VEEELPYVQVTLHCNLHLRVVVGTSTAAGTFLLGFQSLHMELVGKVVSSPDCSYRKLAITAKSFLSKGNHLVDTATNVFRSLPYRFREVTNNLKFHLVRIILEGDLACLRASFVPICNLVVKAACVQISRSYYFRLGLHLGKFLQVLLNS